MIIICSATKREQPSGTTFLCTCCQPARRVVSDLRGEARYAVCTQCGHPQQSRGNGQCPGNHKFKTAFVYVTAAQHLSLKKTLEPVFID